MFKSFCKSIIFNGVCCICCVLSFCSINIWFKTFWDFCFENLHATLDSQLIKYVAQKSHAGRLSGNKSMTFVEDQPFLDLKNSNCRASPVGIGSDTPSFWNLQSNFPKHELLQKTEQLHATLDSHLVFDDFVNKKIAFLKNVLATFCRSDKFKSFYTFVLAFELIRSTKGRQNPFQKHDLLHI